MPVPRGDRALTVMQTFNVEKTDSQCVVTWWYFSGDAVFLFGFLAFLTVWCVAITRELFIKQEIWLFIFALLFCGVWCVVFTFAANAPFGKTRLVLHKNGLEIRWTWFFIKRKKRYELANIRCFRTQVHQPNVGIPRWAPRGEITYSLRIIRQVGDISFKVPSRKEELKKLCKQLNAFLETLKQSRNR